MIGTGKSKPRRLLPGAVVEVRSWPEIAATLDQNGMLEGLPFMPEMLRFCGRRFTVSRSIERTCEETEREMKRISNVVFLDVPRCDGIAHGGCQKACRIFWKGAWLKQVHEDRPSQSQRPSHETGDFPFSYSLPDGQYICQSTELVRATTNFPPLDFGSYLRDVLARTYSVWELVWIVSYALYLRVRWLITGKSYYVVEGSRATTTVEVLDLKPGEWVQVKSKSEIVETLDREGKNRGLAFIVDMLPFCGGTFRVLKRLEKMIHDPTRKLIQVKNTVILEGVTCHGCHILRGGCPRDNYHFWREAWLRRVEPPRD